MQIVLRNIELFPVQVTFDDNSVVNLGPDDELTLQANPGGGVVVQEDRIQTRGIMSPPHSMPDTDAAAGGQTEEGSSDDGSDDFRPGNMHTM